MPTTLTIVPWADPIVDTIGAAMSLASGSSRTMYERDVIDSFTAV